MAAVSGPPAAVQDLLALARLPEGTDLLGPVSVSVPRGEDRVDRVLLRVAPGRGAALATALKAAQAARLARGKAEPVRVRIDPPDIG
jgi:primosomal protein N' (replication factor Y)